MKILGVVPSLPKPHYFSKLKIPGVGLLGLLTKARNSGHQVNCLMEEVSPIEPELFRKEVQKADLIAISSLSATHPKAENFARIAKQLTDKPVVMGGPHVTFKPSEGLKFADFVIRFEGELALPKLLEVLQEKGKLAIVSNLSYRKDGIIINNPISPRLPDLDKDAPFPDFDLIRGWRKPPLVPIETSRGCPYNCNFCCVHRMFGKPRYRDPESVVEEIKRLNPKYLFFCDDHFASDPERSKEILNLMLRRLDHIPPWAAQIRIQIGKDKEWLRLAKRTGCKFLCIGLESISNQSLKEGGKGQTLEQIEEYLARFKEMDMLDVVHGSFIVGFDHDDKNTAIKTANWARKIGLTSIQISVLSPLVGTPLRTQLRKEGRLLSENAGDLDGLKATFLPAQMTPEQLQESAFAGMKKFSSPSTIVLFYLRGIASFLRSYFSSLINIQLFQKHLRRANVRFYLHWIVKKIERRSRAFMAQLKKSQEKS